MYVHTHSHSTISTYFFVTASMNNVCFHAQPYVCIRPMPVLCIHYKQTEQGSPHSFSFGWQAGKKAGVLRSQSTYLEATPTYGVCMCVRWVNWCHLHTPWALNRILLFLHNVESDKEYFLYYCGCCICSCQRAKSLLWFRLFLISQVACCSRTIEGAWEEGVGHPHPCSSLSVDTLLISVSVGDEIVGFFLPE